MKTKIDATKILLDAGWTFDEVKAILGETQSAELQRLPVWSFYPSTTATKTRDSWRLSGNGVSYDTV